MKPRTLASLLFFATLALLCWFVAGCASLPFERTYSLEYSDGKQAIAASVTLRPAPVKRTGDGKTIPRP